MGFEGLGDSMRSSAVLLKKKSASEGRRTLALPLHESTLLYELSPTRDSPQSDFLIPKQAKGQA